MYILQIMKSSLNIASMQYPSTSYISPQQLSQSYEHDSNHFARWPYSTFYLFSQNDDVEILYAAPLHGCADVLIKANRYSRLEDHHNTGLGAWHSSIHCSRHSLVIQVLSSHLKSMGTACCRKGMHAVRKDDQVANTKTRARPVGWALEINTVTIFIACSKKLKTSQYFFVAIRYCYTSQNPPNLTP